MANVILICGTLCSGKTTLAKEICTQTGAVRLSCDALMLAMFPQDGLGQEYEKYAQRAKTYLLTQAADLVKAGMTVVLDWGFWTRSERKHTMRWLYAQGISAQWRCTKVSAEEWQKYIDRRNDAIKNGLSTEYLVDEALKNKALTRFEPMTDDEMKLYATFS